MMSIFKPCHLTYMIVLLFIFGLINCLAMYYYFLHKSDMKRFQKNEIRSVSLESPAMKHFCNKVQQRIEEEHRSNNSMEDNTEIKPPNFTNETERQLRIIPYRYSDWLSSSDFPRRLTPCEHQLYTELLSIIDHFFRRHSISYMIVDGTLLGSYTHHDFLPWDDDVDIRVPNKDRPDMLTALRQELDHVITIAHVEHEEYGSYDKIFFSWASRAGQQKWTYPFIDIGYFDENSTHVWQANYGFDSIDDCAISKEKIFPLVWRPFGEIWLPGPREPFVIFELHRWVDIDKMYYAGKFSHKLDRPISPKVDRIRSEELYSYYPWVKRNCQDNHCTEQLVLLSNNTMIIKHHVIFDKYRSESYFDPNSTNRTCLI